MLKENAAKAARGEPLSASKAEILTGLFRKE